MIGRAIGWILIGLALVIAGGDLLASLSGAEFRFTPLGELWFRLDSGSLNLVQAVIQRYVWPPLWDPGIVTILQWPAALIFAIPGLLLLLSRRRVRRRMFS